MLARDLHPDLVISDIHHPGPDGIEIATRLKQELPEIKVIIWSADCGQHEAARAAGVAGYFNKVDGFHDIPAALEAALRDDG
jgi:DNA-binding NarL/FixJ family response regulator